MLVKIFSLVLISLLIFAGKAYYDTNTLEIKRYQIQNGSLEEVMAGLKVAHLSDLHFSTFAQREEKILKILKQEKPDLILITGDLIGYKGPYRPVISFIDQIAAPFGKFAVLGNTEYSNENGSCILCHEERSPGFKKDPTFIVLRNSSVSLDINGKKMKIVGTDDPVKKMDDLQKALGEPDLDGVPSILLSHSPQLFEEASDRGVDLILCGHNHGGQIFFTRYLRKILPLEQTLDYIDGFFHNGKTLMYVSRGIGNSILPFRLGVKPEITFFEFDSTNPSVNFSSAAAQRHRRSSVVASNPTNSTNLSNPTNPSNSINSISSNDPINSIIPINSRTIFLGLNLSNLIETFDIFNIFDLPRSSNSSNPMNSNNPSKSILNVSSPTVQQHSSTAAQKILFDFESDSELEKLNWECGKWFELSEEHVTSGKYSLKVSLPLGQYPGLNFEEIPSNWSKYHCLKMDIFNPSGEIVKFHIRIDDSKSGWDYLDRFDINFELKSGMNHISIPKKSIKTNIYLKPLDLKNIKRMIVFVPNNTRQRGLYLDNIRLE